MCAGGRGSSGFFSLFENHLFLLTLSIFCGGQGMLRKGRARESQRLEEETQRSCPDTWWWRYRRIREHIRAIRRSHILSQEILSMKKMISIIAQPSYFRILWHFLLAIIWRVRLQSSHYLWDLYSFFTEWSLQGIFNLQNSKGINAWLLFYIQSQSVCPNVGQLGSLEHARAGEGSNDGSPNFGHQYGR